jgi:hypothetical protein
MADKTRVSYPSGSRPFGLTYGHWTVMWWRWALSIPKSVNPVMDETGGHASVGQPEKLVWFLSGKFGTEGTVFPKRFCKIPYGRSILFPVINYEANPLEYPELATEHQLLENVRKIEDTITRKQCFVDGTRIEAQRVQSDPKIFELDLAENGPLGVAGHTFAAADGYWIFLKPLKPGNHYISFDGSCEQGKLRSGAGYSVHIDSA